VENNCIVEAGRLLSYLQVTIDLRAFLASTLSSRSSSFLLKREHSYQQPMRIFFCISIGVVLVEVNILVILNGITYTNKRIGFLISVLLLLNYLKRKKSEIRSVEQYKQACFGDVN
jgi:hypothetical protein